MYVTATPPSSSTQNGGWAGLASRVIATAREKWRALHDLAVSRRSAMAPRDRFEAGAEHLREAMTGSRTAAGRAGVRAREWRDSRLPRPLRARTLADDLAALNTGGSGREVDGVLRERTARRRPPSGGPPTEVAGHMWGTRQESVARKQQD